MDGAGERLISLDEKIAVVSKSDDYREAVGVLRCFRGIDTTSAMVLLSELGDITRFSSPRKLMAYLGLTPTEYSSGPRQRRGGITKAGNAFVRRILVEAAWHYRHRPHTGARLRKRRQGQPEWAIALADRAQSRLHRRQHHLINHNGKKSTVATVAVARELGGFIWGALITLDDRTRSAAA